MRLHRRAIRNQLVFIGALWMIAAMGNLVRELLVIIAILIGFGILGAFAVVPFRKQLPFVILAAPLAGLLSLVFGIAAIYSFFDWTLVRSAVTSAGLCLAATVTVLIVLRPRPNWRNMAWALAALVIVGAIVTRTSNSTTLRLGSPGLLYCDATDAMGYAHAADWIVGHRVRTLPDATPQKPYAAWIAVLWRVDPRFGAHFFLALIARIRNVPAAFAYDSAATIAIIAGVLGVAGAFSRSARSLLVVLVGLTISYWYEYGQTGYLGKILGYPSVLMLVGLFTSLPSLRSWPTFCALALIASATAIMHSAIATALIFAVTAAPYFVARLALLARDMGPRKALRRLSPQLWAGGFLVGLAIVSSGLLARPMRAALYPNWKLRWSFILPRIFEIEHQGIGIPNAGTEEQPPLLMGHEEKLLTGLSVRTIRIMTAIAFIAWLCAIGLALVFADPIAIGVLLGPFILFAVFRSIDKHDGAFQLMGLIFPLTVCGIARLTDVVRATEYKGRLSPRFASTAVLALVLLSFGLRVPRYANSLRRYARSDTLKLQRFSLDRVNKLERAIGKEPVEVEVLSNTHVIFVVVELGRRGLNLHWTPQSWWTSFAYMKWTQPAFPPPRLRLVLLNDPVPQGWSVSCRASPFMLLQRQP